MPQIELSGISKRFTVYERPTGRFSTLRGAVVRKKREVQALTDVSFALDAGELVGYIGPNGAGKSTSVKIMSGILTPDSGSCQILGVTPWKSREKHVAQLGVVFGQRSQLWWDLPVDDSFYLLQKIYGIPKEDYRRRHDLLTQTLSIGDLLKTPVRQLSLGQRMRCELVAALLHSPKSLFLDEPTIGLDAVSKLALRDFLRSENREKGTTMLLTTHDMDDIEALCRRVMVIGHGRLLFDGELSRLKQQYAPLHRIRAVTQGEIPAREFPGAASVMVNGSEWEIRFNPSEIPAPKMLAAVTNALPLTDIAIEETSVEEMIASMYEILDIRF